MAYHTTDQDQFNKVLGSCGVRRASFANGAVAVPNEMSEIVKAIKLSTPSFRKGDLSSFPSFVLSQEPLSRDAFAVLHGAAGR
ncbi:MAG: hypothetical protein U0894_19705 [Pirellulales bacterium]